MDIVDEKILRLLQENSRISASDISKIVYLSVSAVSDRLRKLESSGVIKQYTTILNPVVLEKELSAYMLISLKSPQESKSFLDFVAKEKDILGCFYLAGEFDYMIKIITKNTETLALLLNEVKSVSGIIKTNTMVVLDNEKDQHSYLI